MDRNFAKYKKFAVWSLIVLLGTNIINSAESDNNLLNQRNLILSKQTFSNLQMLQKNPDKLKLLNVPFEIYESAVLATPVGGNSLIIENNNPSKSFYAACQSSSSDGYWIDFTSIPPIWDTTGTIHNYTIVPGYNIIPLINTNGPSARLYISEDPLTGVPLLTDPNIWDLMEYNTGGTWDISAVDAVGIPMALDYNGFIVGYQQYPRSFIMSQIANSLSSPFSDGITPPLPTNKIIRILSPKHCVPSDTTCVDTAISNGLNALATQNPTLTSGPYTYSSFSYDAGLITITASCLDTSFDPDSTYTCTVGGTATGPFTSINVLSTAMTEPNDGTGRLTGLLETMIDRGVVYDSTLWGVTGGTSIGFPWNYYQDTARNYDEFSQYSQGVHAWSYNGLNYGLDHDDIYNRSSSVTVPPGPTIFLYIPVFEGTPSPVPQPLTWPNQYYITIGIPPPVLTVLGEIVVNNGQYVLPDLNMASFPCVGLPQSFLIQFTNYPNSNLSITLDGLGGGTVNNPGDWVNGGDIQISGNNIALPGGLVPN